MSGFLELTSKLEDVVQQLNSVLLGDENTTVTIGGEEKPSISKVIVDGINSVAQIVVDAAADINAIKYETTEAGIAATSSGQFFSVVSGEETAFLKLYKNESGLAVYKKTYPSESALNSLYSTIVDEFFVNYVAYGDFISGNPDIRSNSSIVELVNQIDLLKRGYLKGIKWRSSNEFARAEVGTDLNNKFVAGCLLIYSDNPSNLPSAGNVIYTETQDGSIAVTNSRVNGFIQLSPKLILAYEYGQVNQSGATNILIGSSSVPIDDTRFATGFFATYRDTAFDIKSLLSQVLINDRLRADAYKISQDQDFATNEKLTKAIQDYGLEGLPDALTKNLEKAFSNEFVDGDFTASEPKIRSGSKVVQLQNISDFKVRGLHKGLNFRTGGNEFVFTDESSTLAGKYVLGAFYVHSETEEFPASGFVYQSTALEELKALENPSSKELQINSKFKLYLYKGRVSDIASVKLAIGSTLKPVSTELYASGFYYITSDQEISFSDAINNIFITDKCRNQIVNNLISEKPNLVINKEGEDSYLIGYQGSDEIKRVVKPYPNLDDVSQVKVFNFNGDYINGQVVKTGNDDVAPQRVMNTTVGANHGYTMGKYSANGHGKLDADVGSVYKIGSEQFVILGIIDVNNLWIAHRFDNSTSALVDGTFIHLSGGVDNSSFTGYYTSYQNVRPPFQNRKITILADGEAVGFGSYNFKNSVKFIESYDVLSREEVIAWFIEDRAANQVIPRGREASYTVSMVYEFDKYANCTIYSDIVFLKEIDVQDLMFLQSMRQELDRYYIPKCLPFSSQGLDFDYAMIEPANKPSQNNLSSLYIDEGRMVQGEIVDRYVGFNDDTGSAFVMGYLPVKSASLETRKPNTSDKAWEIRGNTDKMYPRVVDRENFVSTVGEYYSIIGYRNVFKIESGVTAKYPVKSSSGDYFYIDWHDISATQRISLPVEYHGREIITVEKSDNVTLHTDLVTDSISVTVSCLSSYGYLVIKAK